MSTRDLDLVLFGCTGFVGRLTAAHLVRHAPRLRVGLAGRSRERVDSVRAELGVDWPVLVADSGDVASLDAMARTSRVVASTVGPYAEVGLPLVGACVAAGTDYVDLTGEVLFVRDSIDLFHDAAQVSGARIVHSCGFDSVPSELACLLAADAAEDADEGKLTDTTLFVRRLRGGISGGTIASLKGQVDAATSSERAARLTADPYALSPVRADAPEVPEPEVVVSRTGDRWSAPFFMGPYNRQIVHRSNALMNLRYGPGFKYRELHDTGRGRGAFARAVSLAGMVPAATAGLTFGPTRSVLDRVLPAPGDGPSERARERGAFTMEVVSTTTTGALVRSRVSAEVDPGYDGTAIMLAEATRTLLDEPGPGGVLTPATALGTAYATRLETYAFGFETLVRPGH
ncbi:trans-acting enoyl reductase family protein [Mariniluteicoccus endophyticus]